QRLYRLADGRRRLEIRLDDDWRARPADQRTAPVDGVLVAADGARPLAVVAGNPVPLEGGELLAVVEGVPVQLDEAGPGSLLGARLRDAAGLGTVARGDAAAAGSSPVAGGPLPMLAMALGFAFAGGLILNLMPCVFPVIGLKILGFAGRGRRRRGLRLDRRGRVRRLHRRQARRRRRRRAHRRLSGEARLAHRGGAIDERLRLRVEARVPEREPGLSAKRALLVREHAALAAEDRLAGGEGDLEAEDDPGGTRVGAD